MKRTILLLSLMLTMLSACRKDSDDDIMPSPVPEAGTWEAIVVSGGDVLPYRATYTSVTVSIRNNDQSQKIAVTSTADWLTVMSDTLAADSIVAFKTSDNPTGARREAALVFTQIGGDNLSAAAILTQLSQSDLEQNGDMAREQLYVGYGYDIYKALESPMAVRTLRPILDYSFMVTHYNVAAKYQMVQDCRLTRNDVRYVSSEDIHAFGRDLSELQTCDIEHNFDGCIVNCMEAKQVLDASKGTIDEQNIGYGSIEKVVAARIIDKGVLMDLQHKGAVPYDDEFSTRLHACRAATGDTRRKKIEQLVADYGTHLITQTDLGGRINYTFTMQKSASFNSREEMRQEIDYTLGRISEDDRTAALQEPSSIKSASGSISVTGGGESERKALESRVKSLTGKNQIDPQLVTNWLASINYSPRPEADENLQVVHFELMPLWNIVHDDIKSDIMEVVLSMSSRSDCALPASFTGTDIYKIDVTGADRTLFSFAASGEQASLCRILYLDDYPILQVCCEYVPKIRTDSRVVVAYPIYKQHIRLNQGIFIGDGIHAPAYVGFSGGDCYVNPLEDLTPGSYVDEIYYVNGNLLAESPTKSVVKPKRRNVQDDYLMLYTSDADGAKTHRHPLVKIGSKFWTRHDIDHLMQFSASDDGSYSDQMLDGILYTRFQWETNSIFNAYNSWTWGYAPNEFYDDKPNTKWYLPMPDDVRELYTFLGFNPKALYKGQVSGYEAQFNGYYGQSDIHNMNRIFSDRTRALRYNGELNVISSKSTSSYKDACILVLNPDYTFEIIDDATYRNSYRSEWRNNYYPVRAVRGRMFEYPLLSTIKRNQR